MTPSPQPGHGAYKKTLWDPVAKIGAGQVAGNSNLKLGDTPRGLSLVPKGTAYANRVRNVPRRGGVTAEGPDLPKKPRVPEEASWVVVGRGRRSRPGPVQSALEGRIATHGSLYARRRAASGSSARFAQGPGETRTMRQSPLEIPRLRPRRRKRHVSASRRRYKEETGRSASIDWSALEDVAAVPEEVFFIRGAEGRPSPGSPGVFKKPPRFSKVFQKLTMPE